MPMQHPKQESTAKRQRGKFIGFWADTSLYEQVKNDADSSGLTVSDYLRELVTDAPVPRKQRAPQAARVEVGKFIGHLGKLSSNCNQLARQANRAALVGHWESMPRAQQVMDHYLKIEALLQEVRANLRATMGKK